MYIDNNEINKYISSAKDAQKNNDVASLKNILAKAVVGYEPMAKIVDPLNKQST